MLHLLSQSPLPAAIIERIGSGDDVVLLDSAVCSALVGHQSNFLLGRLIAAGCRVFVLEELSQVYGIQPERVMADVKPVDYAGLVELTVQHPVIHSWC